MIKIFGPRPSPNGRDDKDCKRRNKPNMLPPQLWVTSLGKSRNVSQKVFFTKKSRIVVKNFDFRLLPTFAQPTQKL